MSNRIWVDLPYDDNLTKQCSISKTFLSKLEITDLSKIPHCGKTAAVYCGKTAAVYCGKTAAVDRGYRGSSRCAVRMQILTCLEEAQQARSNWNTLVTLHARFPDIVTLPIKSALLPHGEEEIFIEISEWCTETFEEWARRSTRTVAQLVQAVEIIVEKFDLLNAGGVFHRDSHGNNVMRLESGEWRIIDWDEVKQKHQYGYNFDSVIFLAFAVLVLQKAMERHKTLFQKIDRLRSQKKYRFNYETYRKYMGYQGPVAVFYKNKLKQADTIMETLANRYT